ncbi:carbohydrate ABC transporter permease [Micromonospora endophytica]|uniref:Sugar ABC transporter permease n=1 Tax=Micromonospora endophytica TaxID=515350 RepID=A0A2W2CNH8_9ACTN|nr:sugar ABC transporter permease [Micromonospora endophytica]PZG01022.1 sugar ABC transporter permease [Micromonospora endophytica]RIW47936.1 sugar ABC transporter permease [Micromonospora endophytica]BCJ62313.1 sugar ABC transporter permease [Micromonospora endophytica]
MTTTITTGADATPRRTVRPTRPDRKQRWARRAPLLPALLFAIVVTQLPFLFTLYLSTQSWNALRPGSREFIGLANYATVLSDDRLRAALVNTVVLTASSVLVSVLLGLGLALLLDRRFPGRGIVRTLLITPFLVMPMAAALLWKHAIYNPSYGLINGIFGGNTDWVSQYPMVSVVAALVWQWTPFMMLIILAGLQGQSLETLEAARVDGAGPWQTFTRVTLPYLRPYLELGALLGSIYLVQTFDAVFTITQGGPGRATTNLPYEIYLTTFRKFEYGEAAAAGVVVVIGTILVATFALRLISSLFRMEDPR